MQRGECVVTVLDADDIERLDAAQWEDLSANALDANPFYARGYLLAGLATIDRDSGLKAVAIHTGERLIGLFPFQFRRLPFPTAVGAANMYQMSGQPLIHRDHAGVAVDAWLDAATKGAIPRRWSFPHLDLDSRFAHLCHNRRDGSAIEIMPMGTYSRAGLRRMPGGFAAHMANVVSRGRVRDIQRTLRRLGELGDVQFERATDTDLVAQRVDDFLAMEHAGWKGEEGTSFCSDPMHTQFARRAFGESGTTSVDSLLLDGRPIAISINAHAGGTIFTPKCAYDETYRRFSPGLALEYLVIEAFYASDDAFEMDAATTVDGHLMERLWNVEKSMGRALVGPSGWGTKLTADIYTTAASGRASAKAMLAQSAALPAARQMLRTIPAFLRALIPWGRGFSCLILYI